MASTTPALSELLTSTKLLLDQFLIGLSSSTDARKTLKQTEHSNLDCLDVLRNAADLLKAHTTKLGLLLLNKPFTASAVAKILAEINGTCMPAIMGAVEVLGLRFGVTVEAEVRSAVRQVVTAVAEICKDIESVAKSPGKQELKKQSDSTLASTGQVWSACDGLVELATLGPVGIVCRKAEEHRQLLRDAIEELKEFSTEEDEGYDDDEVSDQDSDVQFGPSHIPSSRPELREQMQAAVKKLGLLDVGMKAISKRRLKTCPFTTEGFEAQSLEQLDVVMASLKQLPEEVDELAGKFYEFDEVGAKKQLQICIDELTKAADLVKDGWKEASSSVSEDKPFAEWVDRWKSALQQ